MPIGQVARKLGVSEQTLYTCKKKYASLDTSDIRKVRQLEEENSKLKRLVADLSLDKVMLKESGSRAERTGWSSWRGGCAHKPRREVADNKEYAARGEPG